MGKITVLCHGCFDVLHAGHIAHFEAAKKHGDYLIVSVTSDRFVNKGPGRPYFDQDTRMKMLKSLRIVDEVILSDEPTALDVIARVKPAFYVKGQDYANGELDIDAEAEAVKIHGGQVVFTDEVTNSSSKIINNCFSIWSEEQKEMIDLVNAHGGFRQIEKIIQRMEGLSVLTIGEPIRDVYRFVEPQGVSSKSPSLSCRFVDYEFYEGGSLAIDAHLSDFCKTDLEFPHTLDEIYKTRYVTADKYQRLFEETRIPEYAYLTDDDRNDFLNRAIKKANDSDLVLFADFGHGLFDQEVVEAFGQIKTDIALNVQTNSSNYGFNLFTKHKRYEYLCIDRRELELAFGDRETTIGGLADRVVHMSGRPMSVTIGPGGSLFLDDEGNHTCSPAFAPKIVDTIGAGDAYFAITSLLYKVEAHPIFITFIGNVFAGLKTEIIGNKEPVTKTQLLKSCKAILS